MGKRAPLALLVVLALSAVCWLSMRPLELSGPRPEDAKATTPPPSLPGPTPTRRELPLRENRRFDGIVRSTTDQPIVDWVTCLLAADDDLLSARCEDSRAELTSSLELRSSSPDGHEAIVVSSPHHLARTFHLGEAGETPRSPTVELEPATSAAHGRVVDVLGGPVPGATVLLSRPNGSLLHADISDTEGRFQVWGLPEEATLSVLADGYAPSGRQVRLPANGLEISLSPGSWLRGRVVTEEGHPVADVTVRAVLTSGINAQHSRSNDRGAFTFQALAPGDYTVTTVSSSWSCQPVTLSIGLGNDEELELRLTSGGSLLGTVLADGKPCESGLVKLEGPASAVTSIEPSAGEFAVHNLLPGAYVATIECHGTLPAQRSFEFGAGLPQRVTWNVNGGGAVHGRVLSMANDTPRPGVSVRLESVGDPSTRVSVTSTSGTGEFSFNGLPLGEFTCSVDGALGSESTSVHVTVQDGSVSDIDLYVQEAATLVVTVRRKDPQSEWSGAVLIQRDADPPVVGAPVGGDQYLFEHLATGTYRVRVEEQTATVHVREAETTHFSVELDNTAVLEGSVEDTLGTPVPDATIEAHSVGESLAGPSRIATTYSDEDGRFALRGLSATSLSLQAFLPADSTRSSRLLARPGDKVRLVLSPLTSLSGRVVDASGEGIDLFVLVAEQGGTQKRLREFRGTAGSFTIDGLSPGPTQFSVFSDLGQASAHVEVGNAATELVLTVSPNDSGIVRDH